jgi:hypothetical protein
MILGTRFRPLHLCFSCSRGHAASFWWHREARLWRLLVSPLLIRVCLGIATSVAAPRGGLGPGYGPFDDPRAIQDRIESDYRGTWHAFKTTTSDLRNTLGTADANAASLLTQIQTNAAFLDAKWTVWFHTHAATSAYTLQDPYLTTLHGDLRVLRRLKKDKDKEASLDALREVALDLQTKADNCRNSSDGLGKEIKVKVRTKSAGKEIVGFEVYYVPRGLLDMKSARDRFPRESSPTDERILNPGRYAMWARKSGFTSKPETLTIGGHGETHLEVDLEVPAD